MALPMKNMEDAGIETVAEKTDNFSLVRTRAVHPPKRFESK